MLRSDTLQITPEILSLIARIDEFKGAWRALGTLAPDRLSALRRVATIESIGSSTRIEGSKLSDREVERLLSNLEIKSFATRDEQEVAGYAELMDLVFRHGRTSRSPRTTSSNCTRSCCATARRMRGTGASTRPTQQRRRLRRNRAADRHRVRDRHAVRHAAPDDRTGAWVNDERETGHLHPLLIIAIFVVVFLEIHPFQDGNGRLSRVLTTLLLLQAGYAYVPYSSLESVIEQSKEAYYLALRQTQGTIRTEAPELAALAGVLPALAGRAGRRLEKKVERERSCWPRCPNCRCRSSSSPASMGASRWRCHQADRRPAATRSSSISGPWSNSHFASAHGF
jgi:Fic family protein